MTDARLATSGLVSPGVSPAGLMTVSSFRGRAVLVKATKDAARVERQKANLRRLFRIAGHCVIASLRLQHAIAAPLLPSEQEAIRTYYDNCGGLNSFAKIRAAFEALGQSMNDEEIRAFLDALQYREGYVLQFDELRYIFERRKRMLQFQAEENTETDVVAIFNALGEPDEDDEVATPNPPTADFPTSPMIIETAPKPQQTPSPLRRLWQRAGPHTSPNRETIEARKLLDVIDEFGLLVDVSSVVSRAPSSNGGSAESVNYEAFKKMFPEDSSKEGTGSGRVGGRGGMRTPSPTGLNKRDLIGDDELWPGGDYIPIAARQEHYDEWLEEELTGVAEVKRKERERSLQKKAVEEAAQPLFPKIDFSDIASIGLSGGGPRARAGAAGGRLSRQPSSRGGEPSSRGVTRTPTAVFARPTSAGALLGPEQSMSQVGGSHPQPLPEFEGVPTELSLGPLGGAPTSSTFGTPTVDRDRERSVVILGGSTSPPQSPGGGHQKQMHLLSPHQHQHPPAAQSTVGEGEVAATAASSSSSSGLLQHLADTEAHEQEAADRHAHWKPVDGSEARGGTGGTAVPLVRPSTAGKSTVNYWEGFLGRMEKDTAARRVASADTRKRIQHERNVAEAQVTAPLEAGQAVLGDAAGVYWAPSPYRQRQREVGGGQMIEHHRQQPPLVVDEESRPPFDLSSRALVVRDCFSDPPASHPQWRERRALKSEDHSELEARRPPFVVDRPKSAALEKTSALYRRESTPVHRGKVRPASALATLPPTSSQPKKKTDEEKALASVRPLSAKPTLEPVSVGAENLSRWIRGGRHADQSHRSQKVPGARQRPGAAKPLGLGHRETRQKQASRVL